MNGLNHFFFLETRIQENLNTVSFLPVVIVTGATVIRMGTYPDTEKELVALCVKASNWEWSND